MKDNLITSERKFGVEVEAVVDNPEAHDQLRESIPRTYRLEHDGSIRGNYPVEMVTSPLWGQVGEEEFKRVMKSMQELGFDTNESCGVHVHLDGSDYSPKRNYVTCTLEQMQADLPRLHEQMASRQIDTDKFFGLRASTFEKISPTFGNEKDCIEAILHYYEDQHGLDLKSNDLSQDTSIKISIGRYDDDDEYFNEEIIIFSRSFTPRNFPRGMVFFYEPTEAELNKAKKKLKTMESEWKEYKKKKGTEENPWAVEPVINPTKVSLPSLISKNMSAKDKVVYEASNPLSFDRTKTLLYYYTVFSDVFLAMLPEDRRQGYHHCRKLSVGFAPYDIIGVRDMNQLEQLWYKTTDLGEINMRRQGKYDDSRYYGLNLHSLFSGRPGTIEIRYHGGTLDSKKILLWVSLHQHIVDRISDGTIRTRDIDQFIDTFYLEEKIAGFFRVTKLPKELGEYVKNRINTFTNIKV